MKRQQITTYKLKIILQLSKENLNKEIRDKKRKKKQRK